MAKRPVEKYDFKAFGEAIKEARKGRKESRKKVSDEMYISPRYLANIENNGQHPSLQIFFELIQRYNISVCPYRSYRQGARQAAADLCLSRRGCQKGTGLRIVTATAEEIAKVEKEGR